MLCAGPSTVLTWCRFIDSEEWRKTYAGVGVEELVRTFDYKERPEVFQFYPQYYHKTDKVRLHPLYRTFSLVCTLADRTSAGWSPPLH